MAKKKKKPVDAIEAEAELTPMIDVTFLLLIFFVLNLKFKVEEGEIESFLPKNRGQGSGTPQIDLGEVRMKLLWYDSSGQPTKSKENGHVVLKVGRNPYNSPGELTRENSNQHPIWDKLYADLQDFKAGYKGKSDKGIPVIIDARPQVPYMFVVRALNEVVKSDLKDVTFAAPEKPIN